MNLLALMGLLAWFIVLGVLAVGFILFVVACCLRKWKLVKWTLVVTFGTAIATAVFFTAVILFVWRPYDPTSETDLKEAYRAEFETLPPPGITVLKARQVVIGDAGGQWLLLRASPEEIPKHIARGFAPVNKIPADFQKTASANAPKWWAPPLDHLQFYENKNWTKVGGWSDSHAAIGVDTSTGLIWLVASKMN